MRRSLWMAALATCLLLGAHAAQAADVELRMASVAPEGTPWIDSMTRYETVVDRTSGNTIDVQIYPAGQLGDEQQVLQQIRRGRLEGGFVSSAALSSVIPELGMLEVPFLWDSPEELDYVMDNYVIDALRPLFDAKGMILVDVMDVGWIHILAGRPIIKPADAKGLKPRAVQTKMSMGFWEELGANPVALPYTDVLPSLQTGLVNGTDNELVSIFFAEFYKAANQLTLSFHSYQLGAIVLSKTWFDTLTAEQQSALLAVEGEERQRSRQEVRGLQDWILGQLKENSVDIHELTPEQIADWRAAFDDFDQQLAADLGGDSEALYSLIQKGKKAYHEQAKN